jgi:hypothetical protein|eukprot:2811869-Prymnesium_polylepis.2
MTFHGRERDELVPRRSRQSSQRHDPCQIANASANGPPARRTGPRADVRIATRRESEHSLCTHEVAAILHRPSGRQLGDSPPGQAYEYVYVKVEPTVVL